MPIIMYAKFQDVLYNIYVYIICVMYCIPIHCTIVYKIYIVCTVYYIRYPIPIRYSWLLLPGPHFSLNFLVMRNTNFVTLSLFLSLSLFLCLSLSLSLSFSVSLSLSLTHTHTLSLSLSHSFVFKILISPIL